MKISDKIEVFAKETFTDYSYKGYLGELQIGLNSNFVNM